MTPLNGVPTGRALHRLVLSVNHLATVRELLQHHLPGVEVRAFGSRAGGHPKPASDLDLMVLSDEPLEPRRYALLADAFAESDLPFKVDVIDASTTTPSFRADALAESIVVQTAQSGGG
jgi:uncharacterized protein